MADELSVESYGVQESGFIVIMNSKPKAAAPPAAASIANTPPAADTTASEKPPEAHSATAPAVTPTPADESTATTVTNTPAAPPPSSDSTAVFNESTFLTGPALEETINNIKAMGFSEEMVRRALVVSYNNPDRAVELLLSNDPSLRQPPTAGGSPTSQEQQERPREPTPGIALSPEEAADTAGLTSADLEEMT